MVKLFNSQRFKLVRVENHSRNENEMQNLRLEQMFVVQRFSSGFILGINQVTEQTGCSYCKNLIQAFVAQAYCAQLGNLCFGENFSSLVF